MEQHHPILTPLPQRAGGSKRYLRTLPDPCSPGLTRKLLATSHLQQGSLPCPVGLNLYLASQPKSPPSEPSEHADIQPPSSVPDMSHGSLLGAHVHELSGCWRVAGNDGEVSVLLLTGACCRLT